MPRKNLDLSEQTIKKLTKMATKAGNKFKPFVEFILTQIAEGNTETFGYLSNIQSKTKHK